MKEEITREVFEWYFSREEDRHFKDRERAKKMCEMRLAGATYKAIGEELGTHGTYVRESINRILRYWRHHKPRFNRAETELDLNLMLYLDFRNELDKICVPEILRFVKTTPIMDDGEQVGILCTADQGDWIYIDALYILPMYRRKGLARKAVKEWLAKQRKAEIRLHIIHKNKVAFDFWNSIFELDDLAENEIDGLYRVTGVRK